MEFAIWVTAIATGVIAWNAWGSHRLSSKIQSRDDEFRQELKDLYGAIVLSNLLSSDSGLDQRKKLFEDAYGGKTSINLWK